MSAGELLSHEIVADGPRASCAACGANPGGQRVSVEGKAVMLCVDAGACARRYRRGLTPAQYAARLRNAAPLAGDWPPPHS